MRVDVEARRVPRAVPDTGEAPDEVLAPGVPETDPAVGVVAAATAPPVTFEEPAATGPELVPEPGRGVPLATLPDFEPAAASEAVAVSDPVCTAADPGLVLDEEVRLTVFSVTAPDGAPLGAVADAVVGDADFVVATCAAVEPFGDARRAAVDVDGALDEDPAITPEFVVRRRTPALFPEVAPGVFAGTAADPVPMDREAVVDEGTEAVGDFVVRAVVGAEFVP